MTIKVYKKKIVVFDTKYKSSFTYYRKPNFEGSFDHAWKNNFGQEIVANAEYYSESMVQKEIIGLILKIIEQRHCDHVESESEWHNWTECVKCKILMSYNK